MSSGTSKDKNTTSGSSLRRRFYSEAVHEWPVIGWGVAAMFVTTAANQALPWVIGRLIDGRRQERSIGNSNYYDSSGRSSSLSLTHSLGLVVFAGGLASAVRTIALQTAAARIAARLRLMAVSHLLIHQPLQWFQNASPAVTSVESTSTAAEPEIPQPAPTNTAATATTDTTDSTPKQTRMSSTVTATSAAVQGMSPASVQSVLTDDVTKMADSLTTGTANLIRSTSAVVWSTYHMIAVNPTLLAIAMTVVPVVGAAAMLLHKSVQRVSLQQRQAAETAASFLYERLTHIAMVRHANRSHDELVNYEALQLDSVSRAQTKALYGGAFMGFLFSAIASALSLVVWKGSQSVRDGVMTGGQLTTFSTHCFLLGLGSSGVIKALAETSAGLVAAERYYNLLTTLDREQKENDSLAASSNTININVDEVEAMEVQKVSFAYATGKTNVLDGLSFQLKRGKVVALVGRNGEGKSTIVSLLAGLFRPESGKIQVIGPNGIVQDYTKMTKASKKSLVQVIPQSTALFNMSILENVRYSNPTASLEQVQAALNDANCHEFVSRLDDGINTIVGLNGCCLSGGERQKLALARCIISDPVVLVMDEPTTSMDEQGMVAVSEAVVRSTRDHNRCLLLISHQPKTLELADSILVLKEGRIVEQGEFSQLRANESSELCQLMPDVYRKA